MDEFVNISSATDGQLLQLNYFWLLTAGCRVSVTVRGPHAAVIFRRASFALLLAQNDALLNLPLPVALSLGAQQWTDRDSFAHIADLLRNLAVQ